MPRPGLLRRYKPDKDSEPRLRVALVGCGKAADMHLSGIQTLSSAKIDAVCDIEPLMAEQLAARYGIARSYSDFHELIAVEKPDVLHIATPPQSHCSLAMDALDAGCHLVIDKPLALDSREAGRLIAHAKDCSRKLTIGYTYYFDPVAVILRRLVLEGVMGEPVHMESYLGYDLNGPFGSVILADQNHWVHRLPGKLFQNVLDHLLSKITEFLPDELPVVQAYSWQSADCPVDYNLPDELRAVILGAKRSAYVTFSSGARPVRHCLDFHGSKNSAHLDFDNSTIILGRTPALPGILGRLTSPFASGWDYFREGGRNLLRFTHSDCHYFSGFNYLLSEFYDSIIHDLPVPIPYANILRTAALVDQIVYQVQGEHVRTE